MYLCVDPSGATGIDPEFNPGVWDPFRVAEPVGRTVTPEQFGAKGDGVRFGDGQTTVGSQTLTTALASEAKPGQKIYVAGAGTAGAGLSTTVASVGSGTLQMTAAAQTAATGASGWFGTDDAAAFQQAVDEVASEGGTILMGGRDYLLDGSLQSPANSVVAIPDGANVVNFVGDPGGNCGNTHLLSTRISDTYSGTGEPPSLIGMEPGTGLFKVYGGISLSNFTIHLPANPSLGGLNASPAAGFEANKVAVTVAFLPTTPFASPALPTKKWSFGLRLPGGGYGNMSMGYVVVQGCYCGMAIAKPDHWVFEHALCQNCVIAYGFEESAGGGHTGPWTQVMSEYNVYHLGGWSPVNGAQSHAGNPIYLQVTCFDIEEAAADSPFATVYHVLDNNNKLNGNLWFNRYAFGGPQSSLLVSGGSNLDARQIAANPPRAKVFTTNATWKKPSGVTFVRIDAIGGGGGGASGGTGAPSGNAQGGWGGQAGGYSSVVYAASDLPDSVAVTIGMGGAGASGRLPSEHNAGPGTSGSKNGTPSSFGTYLVASGGTGASGGSLFGQGTVQQGAPGGLAPSGAAGNAGGSQGMVGAGGSGGGISSGTPTSGGAGGSRIGQSFGTGATAGANGASSTAAATALGGGGGGGGNASVSANGGAGGNGGQFGGGGGGGGASVNGRTSGVGGNGAPGIVVVTAW